MKRDFLKNLGIEDNDIISKILDENSADIGRAKGELQTYKDKVADLEGKIATKDGEIATLTKKVGDTDSLNQKITQLEADNSKLTNDLNTQVSKLKKGHAIEGAIRDAKGKNIKAIRALLDEEKITYENDELGGITEQLEALAKAEDSSMLFGGANAPSGTHINTPNNGGKGGSPSTSMSLADAVAKALSK